MDNNILLQVLKQWNLREKTIDTGILRGHYIQMIYPYLERKEVIVLKGIRRSGKSTLLRQLMLELTKRGVGKNQLLYLNLEDYNFANDLQLNLFDQVLEVYKKYSKNKKQIYFFIDEIQKITHWETWIRTQYDQGEPIKFIITGSSASLLSKELSTILTGRNISFQVTPLSFKEFLTFTRSGKLEEYMTYGGFPEVVLESAPEKKRMLLQQYFEDIIHKDIIDRYTIRNAKQVFEIARYLVGTSGAKVSFNKLSKVFGLSKDTIALYVSYMLDAFLLCEVTYFSYSARTKHDVTKLSKFYALDTGLIYAMSFSWSQNSGQFFENAVFIKLYENRKEISYWSELKSEVDFIVDNQAINVTSTDQIPAREMQGLQEFQKNRPHFITLLITKSTTKDNMISLQEFLR